MYEEMPTAQRVREMIIEELKKFKTNEKHSNPPKNKTLKKEMKIKKKSSKEIKSTEYKLKNNKTKITYNSSACITLNTKKRNSYSNINKRDSLFKIKKKYSHLNILSSITINPGVNNIDKKYKEKNEKKETQKSKQKVQKDNSNVDYNSLTFERAKVFDNRNIFQIFKSILFDELELINLFISKKRIKLICICEYILSLLFDFFFNTLLYSDDIVSHKYHNNGELDFIVSLTLSLLSNIISSIVCHYVQYSDGIEERLEQILEIRRENKYLYALNQFFKFLKYRMVTFLLTEIILVFGCFYYIIIFCIIYSKSQKSLFINYIYSLLEGLLTSLIITISIVVTRKIGICYSNSYLYNTSKYLNDKF